MPRSWGIMWIKRRTFSRFSQRGSHVSISLRFKLKRCVNKPRALPLSHIKCWTFGWIIDQPNVNHAVFMMQTHLQKRWSGRKFSQTTLRMNTSPPGGGRKPDSWLNPCDARSLQRCNTIGFVYSSIQGIAIKLHGSMWVTSAHSTAVEGDVTDRAGNWLLPIVSSQELGVYSCVLECVLGRLRLRHSLLCIQKNEDKGVQKEDLLCTKVAFYS